MNPWEEWGRTKKVLALLAVVPATASRRAREITAQWLEGMTRPECGVLATLAGCKAPSDETWRELVAAVRARRTVEDETETANKRGEP